MKNILLILLILSVSILGQSLNKTYTVSRVVNGSAKEKGEFNFVEYSVKSNSGKELYKIVDKVDYDIPYSKLEVFEDGSSVLISSFYGTLTFISDSGTKAKVVEIKKNIVIEYERSIKSVSDENNIVVLFSELNKKQSTIKKYNSEGVIINEFLVDFTNINGIAYSKKNNQLFLSQINFSDDSKLERKIISLNGDGKVVKSFNASFEKGFFTDDNQFVGISNKSVLLINTSDLELGYEINADESSLFIDVAEEDNLIVIAQAKNPDLKNGEWYYKNPTIIKLDSDGNIAGKTEIETELFSEFRFQKASNNLEFVVGKKTIIVE